MVWRVGVRRGTRLRDDRSSSVRSRKQLGFAALASHAWGGDSSGHHQPHGVAVGTELARPAVRARANLHPDHAGRQRRNHRAQLGACKLGLARHHRSPLIDAVRGKDVLRQNDAGRNNAQRPPLRAS